MNPKCDLCGAEMLLDERVEYERQDDQECGIPPVQYVCFCNGGNYRAVDEAQEVHE